MSNGASDGRFEVSLLGFGTGDAAHVNLERRRGEARVGELLAPDVQAGPYRIEVRLGLIALLFPLPPSSSVTVIAQAICASASATARSAAAFVAATRASVFSRLNFERAARGMRRDPRSDDGVRELRASTLAADGAGRALDTGTD